MSQALVVLSGGQDSTTCLFWALNRYGSANVHAVTYNYGQRHSRELAAAVKVADLAGISSRHHVVSVGPLLQGRSPLTDFRQPLEQYSSFEQMNEVIGERVELTFVPMRNALFLTLAANHATVRDIWNLVTGVCQQDGTNYPDCRPEFIRSMNQTINEALGTTEPPARNDPWYGMKIHTPLMDLTKDRSIQLAMTLPGCYRALAYSHTAYDGQYPPLGQDHASVLRRAGFEAAGVPDPLVLRAIREGKMSFPETDNYKPSAINKVLDLLTPSEMPSDWS